MSIRPAIWVFLGDSLVEGVGRARVSLISSLVQHLRGGAATAGGIAPRVGYVRLRRVDPATFSRYVNFNFAGEQDLDGATSENDLVLLNLGSEGTTIDEDFEWLPFLQLLRPDRVVVMRGALESILRPACITNGSWPWWVPQAWRSPVALDPRCYFSTTWWRSIKQRGVDRAKQVVRAKLLRQFGAAPLKDRGPLLATYKLLIEELRKTGAETITVALLPVSGRTFPGSPNHFSEFNRDLADAARTARIAHWDWQDAALDNEHLWRLFYRDGFHPNADGADKFSEVLATRLQPSWFAPRAP